MKVLALTSSSTQASVALTDGDLSVQKIHSTPRGHSEFMNAAIDELLNEAGWKLRDLNLIAVDQGPGSFTGIRVAVSVARSLCYLLKKPCFVSQSLLIMATQAAKRPQPGTLLCGMNAYKNLIFFSAHTDQQKLGALTVLTPNQIEKLAQTFAQPWSWAGNGLVVYHDFLTDEFRQQVKLFNPPIEHPEAQDLAHMALQSSPSSWIQDWKLIAPLYLRDSAAEESLRNRS
ncbi:MAG: tRNA (adenosine(37)-N6)-threonylcarbamoyltransferase complex dimerization subunit type 1 TsaB [Bdellovibrio sp.]|jgi:tRNA threonylcarbamoyladenosine biosynthesis protein TsaB